MHLALGEDGDGWSESVFKPLDGVVKELIKIPLEVFKTGDIMEV